MKDGTRVTFRNWAGEQVSGTAYPDSRQEKATVRGDDGLLYHLVPLSELTAIEES